MNNQLYCELISEGNAYLFIHGAQRVMLISIPSAKNTLSSVWSNIHFVMMLSLPL